MYKWENVFYSLLTIFFILLALKLIIGFDFPIKKVEVANTKHLKQIVLDSNTLDMVSIIDDRDGAEYLVFYANKDKTNPDMFVIKR